MKKGSLMSMILSIIIVLGTLGVNILAASSNVFTQDGLTVYLLTDKEGYKAGESVKATVQVENQTGKEVSIHAAVEVPEEATLVSKSAIFDVILQNEEKWTTPEGVTLLLKKVSSDTNTTGDPMLIGLWIVVTALAVAGVIVFIGVRKRQKKTLLYCFVWLL